eukprot:jgi/Bigna1/80071/fgenesh1_pg.67_\
MRYKDSALVARRVRLFPVKRGKSGELFRSSPRGKPLVDSTILRQKHSRTLAASSQQQDPSWWVGYEHPSLRRVASERADNYLSRGMWEDVNLSSRRWFVPAEVSSSFEVMSLSVFSPKDSKHHPKFSEAIKARYKACKVGDSFGPTWSTHWFKIKLRLPPKQENKGRIPCLHFDTESEGLIFSEEGVPLQALTGGQRTERRTEFFLDRFQNAEEEEKEGTIVTLYIEMAANHMFGAGKGNDILPTDPNRFFVVRAAHVSWFDEKAYRIYWDMLTLRDMAKHLTDHSPSTSRSQRALRLVNEGVNSRASVEEEIRRFLSTPNHDIDHTIYAAGHCHIDTAWLWPYRETRRFTLSQPQQLQWVKDDFPEVFRRIVECSKNGSFVPLGATWIEMDANIPSGESFCRYSCQLPQICRNAGVRYFLTQKLSWNLINKFPHHSFNWVGLDGSSILTHFPPANTYVDSADVGSALYNLKNYKQKAVSKESMMLFGHGDGMPWVKMASPQSFFEALEERTSLLPEWTGELYLELHRGTYTTHGDIKKANREAERMLRDIEIFHAPFSMNNGDKETLDALWKDVLLNQFHDVLPGTAIEEAMVDAMNIYRRVFSKGSPMELSGMERFCHKVAAAVLWKNNTEISRAGSSSSVDGNLAASSNDDDSNAMNGRRSPLHLQQLMAVVNTLNWDRSEVVEIDQVSSSRTSSTMPSSSSSSDNADEDHDGHKDEHQNHGSTTRLAYVSAPSVGVSVIDEDFISNDDNSIEDRVKVTETPKEIIMQNSLVSLTVCKRTGRVLSMQDKRSDEREVLMHGGGNVFSLYDDIPLFWDAWDLEIYHFQTRQEIDKATSVSLIQDHELQAKVQVKMHVGSTSLLTQNITLHVGSPRLDFETLVDWHESRKCLKVEFPMNVISEKASFEVQFGHVERPTHSNTVWDLAKFEVVGHQWADISEQGYGVALLNDCKYGYSARKSNISLSLLRYTNHKISGRIHNPNADMGEHRFRYALYPHQGAGPGEGGVIQEGYALNHPLRVVPLLSDRLEEERQRQQLGSRTTEDGIGRRIREEESSSASSSSSSSSSSSLTGLENEENLLESQQLHTSLIRTDSDRVVLTAVASTCAHNLLAMICSYYLWLVGPSPVAVI